MIATGEISSLSEGRQLVRESFEPKRYQPHHSDEWEEAYQTMRSLNQA
jgi:hypothetical protein